MKSILQIILTLLVGTTLFAQTGTVEVKVTGIIPESGGIIKIGLYEHEGFPTVGKSVAGQNVAVKDIATTTTLANIPVGTYAIAIFQDINSDGKLNSNFFGAPTEPFAFSNNKFGMFGPPKFADVSFIVKNGEKTSLTIILE